MLSVLYANTESTMQICDLLGVSHHPLRKKMVECGLTIAKKGGANFKGIFKPMIMEIPRGVLAKMTVREIAEQVGCTHRHVGAIFRKEKMKYKKMKPGRKNVC
jgi:phage antirepressor YoqD-like protein